MTTATERFPRGSGMLPRGSASAARPPPVRRPATADPPPIRSDSSTKAVKRLAKHLGHPTSPIINLDRVHDAARVLIMLTEERDANAAIIARIVAERGRLREAIRVNTLRWGGTHADADALIQRCVDG